MQTLGGVPVSMMLVAKKLRNAPLLCCRHDVKVPFVQSASDVHGCGGGPPKTPGSSEQKPQKTRSCPPAVEEGNACVPLGRLKPTGRQPMNEPAPRAQAEAS